MFDKGWNEAHIESKSRLQEEPEPADELHFTPGNPRNVRIGVKSFTFLPLPTLIHNELNPSERVHRSCTKKLWFEINFFQIRDENIV